MKPICLAALLCGVAFPVLAQEADPNAVSSVDVIASANQAATVASRVPLAALETPFTIVSVPRSVIDNSAALSLGDILRYGATIGGTDNFGNAGQFFSSRGFQLDNGNNYFRDGLRYRKYGQTPIYDVERVELLRGPASILYGAVQPGGVVNLVSRKPLAQAEQSVRLRAGENSFYQATGDITGPIGDKVRYRLVANYEDADSFRDIVHARSQGVSGTVDIDVTPRTVLTLRGSYFDDHRNGDRGTTTTLTSAGAIVLADIPRSRYLGERWEYLDFNDVNLSASLRHQLNADWQLRADIIRSRQKEDRIFIWGGGGSSLSAPVPVSGIMDRTLGDWDTKLKGTLGRVEAAGQFQTGAIGHKVLFGAEAERFDNYRTDIRYAYPSVNIYAPVYLATRPVTARTTTGAGIASSLYKSRSIYIQDVISLGERFVLLAGLRYDDLKDINRLSSTPNQAKDTNPQVGLVYRATPTLSFYGSYARSFKNQSGTDFEGNPFAPQRGKQKELGVKLDLVSLRTFVTASVYDLKKTNVTTTDPLHPGFSRLTGLQGTRGAEVSVDAKPTDQLRVSLNYAYSDRAKFLIDNSLAGKDIRNVAKHNVAVWGDYDFKGALERLHAGVGVTYVGDRWGNDRNQFVLPSYTLVDLNARYDVTEKVQVAVNLKNLFDKTYYTGSLEHRSVLIGQPRTVIVGVSARF